MRLRQEVVNVALAELLQERGLAAVPEQIIRAAAGAGPRMPDVIVDFQGLRLAIEGEFASTHGAERAATRKAGERVEQGLAHIGMAVIYPAGLASSPFAELRDRLRPARLRFAIVTELPEPPAVLEGSVEDLAEALGRAYEQLVEEEAVGKAVAVLEAAIEQCATALRLQPATTQRLAEALGIWNPSASPDDEGDERGARSLTPAQRTAVNRISGLVLVNATIFQEVLAAHDRRVRPLQAFRGQSDIASRLADHWGFILDDIDYYPIFHIARELLRCLGASGEMDAALPSLVNAALRIVGWRAALRHDLMGRVYHRLLEEAKYLGAYYTSIPAATLLVKLALESDAWGVEWSDLAALGEFRIADLACGTGTLLVAAADAVADNYVRACVNQRTAPDVESLQPALVGGALLGFDVVPSALHLTASTLTLRIPQIPVNVTNLFSLPLGGPEHRLGSLEFLETSVIPRTPLLFGAAPAPERVVGRVAASPFGRLPQLQLCVMNPPFTRSVGGNLLFGSVPHAERREMQRRLRRIVKRRKLSASITAGLGSVFVALADRHLEPGGRLALVLPRALLSGVSWRRTRELLTHGYDVEYLVVCHEPGHYNFSENTNLSEVLVVARKHPTPNEESSSTVCVNLWRNCRNSVEALAIVGQLLREPVPDLFADQGALELQIGESKMGEAISLPPELLPAESWHVGCSYAQAELTRALFHLLQGELYLPGRGLCGTVPLCPLGTIAALGPDARDIHDGFQPSPAATAFPALWGHTGSDVTTMNRVPNGYLAPLATPKPRRPHRRVTDLWPRAGRLLLPERLRLNTMRLAAVRLPTPVLSNMWWPARFEPESEEAEKVVAVWLNSTLGLHLLLGRRLETAGAWVKFKKPVLGSLPVLDVASLEATQRAALVQAFEELADSTLQPFSELEHDPTRAAIDQAVADALRLPDFSILRELLAREPGICGSLDALTRHPYPTT